MHLCEPCRESSLTPWKIFKTKTQSGNQPPYLKTFLPYWSGIDPPSLIHSLPKSINNTFGKVAKLKKRGDRTKCFGLESRNCCVLLTYQHGRCNPWKMLFSRTTPRDSSKANINHKKLSAAFFYGFERSL